MSLWSLGTLTVPNPEEKGEKTGRMSLVIGRGNDIEDDDFSTAGFDDLGIWDYDVSTDFPEPVDVGIRLMGKDCGSNDDLCMLLPVISIQC